MRALLFTAWQIVAGVSVALMMAGSITDHVWLRGWGAAASVLAACLWLRKRDAEAERRYQEYVQRWAHQPFEAGWNARGAAEQIRQRL